MGATGGAFLAGTDGAAAASGRCQWGVPVQGFWAVASKSSKSRRCGDCGRDGFGGPNPPGGADRLRTSALEGALWGTSASFPWAATGCGGVVVGGCLIGGGGSGPDGRGFGASVTGGIARDGRQGMPGISWPRSTSGRSGGRGFGGSGAAGFAEAAGAAGCKAGRGARGLAGGAAAAAAGARCAAAMARGGSVPRACAGCPPAGGCTTSN